MNTKRIISLVASLALVLSLSVGLTGCGDKAAQDDNQGSTDGEGTKYTVGICQLVQHEALDAATQGFIDALNEALPGQVEFQNKNASGDSANCSTIVNGFVSDGVDLIMANATGALTAAAAAVGICAVVTSVGTQATERLLPIYCVERGDKKISLTFDVAWENSNTQELIDILDEYDARATFFVTGDWCDRYPEDVKAFSDAGHEIANHSDQHPHVSGINVNDLITDSRAASLKIEDITGKTPTLYRAPYGEYDNSLITTVQGMGMNVIQWDVEPLDIDGKPLPEPI